MRSWIQRSKKQGFTLIELMIVVAIVGILAVLAIYGVHKYLANAKTTEARNSIGQMGKDQYAEYEKESMAGTTLGPGASTAFSNALCIAPGAAVPAAMTSVKGQKYQSDQSPGKDWRVDEATAGKGFACLGFSMDQPQYYQYTFTSSKVAGTPEAAGDTWQGIAQGDLNGDGTVFSTFQLNGVVQATMTFSLAPNIVELDPEE